MPATERTVCAPDMCVACMACVDACRRACPQLNPPGLHEPLLWRQGWASDPAERAASSSGGAATAISRAFIAGGGLVCSCAQEGDDFTFRLSGDASDLDAMRGSKYVKTNPRGAYRRVREALRAGKEVLFVGLPCQVAAMRNHAGPLGEGLCTVDLICHGTPSVRLLRRYLAEHGAALDGKLELGFRKKGQFQLRWRGAGTPLARGARQDLYTVAFLAGLSYTENCYSCPFACGARVGDVTLGDSWGTELAHEKLGGVSLVLVNTEKGRRLVEGAGLTLLPADERAAKESNGQLVSPTRPHPKRAEFFAELERGHPIDGLVMRLLPRRCLRNVVRGALIGLGVLKR